MENLIFQSEEERSLSQAVKLTCVDQLTKIGAVGVVENLAQQVSDLITNYNQNHPSEMLNKPPNVIRDQFLGGKSVMIVSKYLGKLTVLYHGSLYPAFANGESKKLGYQVIELGSAIAHPDFRGKFGLGTQGTLLRLTRAREIWGDFVGLSTIKQTATLHALTHAGMTAVNFWQHPYLAFLTCSCQNTSESFNEVNCPVRRRENDVFGLDLSVGPSQKIPCTLMVSDVGKATRFEENCRKVHNGLLADSLTPGVINPDSMRKASQLFDLLNKKE